MLVSGGKGNRWWRGDQLGRAVKNGSFIDFHYKDDGRYKWIAVTTSELLRFLESDDKETSISITVDQPADMETALMDFLQRKSISYVK